MEVSTQKDDANNTTKNNNPPPHYSNDFPQKHCEVKDLDSSEILEEYESQKVQAHKSQQMMPNRVRYQDWRQNNVWSNSQQT